VIEAMKMKTVVSAHKDGKVTTVAVKMGGRGRGRSADRNHFLTRTAMTPQVALIPDSVYGAVLLSVIDFFLSFIVISFIGFVLAVFPYLNRTGKALQATPVAVSVMPERDVNAEYAAVIAAAIYATLGARRRIVRIGEARPAPGWAFRARTRVAPSRAPRPR
jgi:hypothetical protein